MRTEFLSHLMRGEASHRMLAGLLDLIDEIETRLGEIRNLAEDQALLKELSDDE